ncbi:unnamed protein product, partial [Arabidopsis halleri]
RTRVETIDLPLLPSARTSIDGSDSPKSSSFKLTVLCLKLGPWPPRATADLTVIGEGLCFANLAANLGQPPNSTTTLVSQRETRSATLFTLSSLKQESCRFLTSYGRGHHRLEKSLPLFGFYFQNLQILVTSSSMVVNSKSLRNSGILIPNLNCRRLKSGLGSSIPKYHSPTISYIDQKHCLIGIAHKFLKSHDTLAMNSNGQRFAYGLGSSLANSHSLTFLYSDFNHHPFANSSNAWILSWYVSLLHVSNLRQALCGMLNLHGQGIHVREDPPVSLQFYTYHFMNPGFNFTCPHHLDLMLQSYSANSRRDLNLMLWW